MALIPINIDITGTALDRIFRDGYPGMTSDEFLNLVIINYRPSELDGYENFRSSHASFGGMDNCIIKATVRCRKIRT